jgi:hypothetical protein
MREDYRPLGRISQRSWLAQDHRFGYVRETVRQSGAQEDEMSEYSMTCSCGDVLRVEADSNEDAVSKIQSMMTEEAMQAHMAQKHAGQPVPTLAQVHAMIAQGVQGS